MNISFVRTVLIIIVLLSQFSIAYANETLQYELTAGKIKKARLFEIEGGYYVDVVLKEHYRKEFAELTGNNIGRRLEIIVSGQIFTSAIIQARIPSGTIRALGKWSSEEDARKYIETLLPDIEIKGSLKKSISDEGDPKTVEMEKTIITDFTDWFITK